MKRLMMSISPAPAVRTAAPWPAAPALVAHAIVLAQKGAPNVAPDGTV